MSKAPVVLLKFEDAVTAGGTGWRAIAFGVETPIGQWEGWLEFTPVGGEFPSITTGREMTQPNRTDLDYWASGPAVLDPFTVNAQGEDVLRKELHALSPGHLEAIVDAYDLEGAHSFAAEGSDRTSDRLIAGILAAAKNSASVPNR